MGKTCGYYLLMVSGCFFGSFILSCDVYYFIPSGAYIEQYGLPHELMFSVHAGEHFHYIMQQWLFALWNWKVYQAFGLYGILFCGYLTKIVLLLLLHRLLLHASGGRRGLAFAETFFAGFFVLMMNIGRPYMLTCGFLLIELLFLQQLRAHPERRRYGYLLFPLLSVLEINLHAAMWPMLLVFLLPYFFESTLGRLAFFSSRFDSTRAIPWRTLAVYAALIFVVALLNPYGLEMLGYGISNSGTPSLRYISTEMQPLAVRAPFLVVLIPLFTVYMIWKWLRWHFELPLLLLVLGTGFMAMIAERSLYLFFPCVMLALARLGCREFPFSCSPRQKRRMLCVGTAAMSLLLLANFILLPKNVIPAEWSAGLQAMREDAAAQGRDIGNVYAVRDIGSYLTFAQIPVYHYSCDEAFTGKMNRRKDILAEYHAVQEQQLPYEEFLRRYDFHYLFVKNDDYLYDALASDEDYTLLYEYDAPQFACSLRVYRANL
ncbi:hypothetical protein [Selenomonas bovis]|uniref:hypothetical protein n=1 Tax=Selenomonas bovis TaxID=416586 RepID=UPI0012DF5834|nr:hypothetical protein [Selenomonas bovis]